MRPFQIQPKRKKSGQRGKGENRASEKEKEIIYKRIDYYAERDLWKEETPDSRGVNPRKSQLEKTAKGIKSSKLCKRPRAVIDKTNPDAQSQRSKPAQTPTPNKQPNSDEAEGRTTPSMEREAKHPSRIFTPRTKFLMNKLGKTFTRLLQV